MPPGADTGAIPSRSRRRHVVLRSVVKSGPRYDAEMTHETVFDAGMIRRFDGAGPRYTSYPTAVQFDSAFGADAYRQAALQSSSRAPSDPLSLYVHIPFCTSPCF